MLKVLSTIISKFCWNCFATCYETHESVRMQLGKQITVICRWWCTFGGVGAQATKVINPKSTNAIVLFMECSGIVSVFENSNSANVDPQGFRDSDKKRQLHIAFVDTISVPFFVACQESKGRHMPWHVQLIRKSPHAAQDQDNVGIKLCFLCLCCCYNNFTNKLMHKVQSSFAY